MARLVLLLIAGVVSFGACTSAGTSAQTPAAGLWFTLPAALLLGGLGGLGISPPRSAALWIAMGMAVGPIFGGLAFVALSVIGGSMQFGPEPNARPGESPVLEFLRGLSLFCAMAGALYAVTGFVVAWVGAEIVDLRASRADPSS